MKIRVLIMWGVALLALGATNILIIQKERLLSAPQSILLELAPRDPRSLVHGDYMALRYALTRNLPSQGLPVDGYLVAAAGPDRVARFVRMYGRQIPLAPGEVLLRYRVRGGTIHVGSESFFFQEGQAALYADARYAELRVDSSGESLLVGLRGPNREPLGSRTQP